MNATNYAETILVQFIYIYIIISYNNYNITMEKKTVCFFVYARVIVVSFNTESAAILEEKKYIRKRPIKEKKKVEKTAANVL